MHIRSVYNTTGVGLLISGATLFLGAFFLMGTAWLAALGLAMVILGIILLTLARAVPRLSPEACRLLLQTGLENMSSLMEELQVNTNAIYLPHSVTGAGPQAFLSLQDNHHKTIPTSRLPHRLIVRAGNAPEDMGLLVSTVGTAASALLETRPGASIEEIESALTYLYTGVLGAAESVRVTGSGNTISITVKKPDIPDNKTVSTQFMGSPLASIAASIASEAFSKPVSIRLETSKKGQLEIELEVMDAGQ